MFHTDKHQNRYKYKHRILIFGYRRFYNTPGRADKLNTVLTCSIQFVDTDRWYPQISIQCLIRRTEWRYLHRDI